MCSFEALQHYQYVGIDMTIRRYLNPFKFNDFAKTGELYLAPALTMADPEEGFFTVVDQQYREDQLRRVGFTDSWMNTARKSWDHVAASNAKATLLSCWSMGVAESSQMWAEYGESNENSVAVETTIYSLQKVLGPAFLIAPVKYVEREKVVLPEGHSLIPFLYKGSDFAWERELRIVANMEIGARIGSARRVPLNLEALDPLFLTAPGASPSRVDEVKAALSTIMAFPRVARSALTGD